MTYRIWYGNGQVSAITESLEEAERWLAESHIYSAYAKLSRYEGDGDWSIRKRDGSWTLLL